MGGIETKRQEGHVRRWHAGVYKCFNVYKPVFGECFNVYKRGHFQSSSYSMLIMAFHCLRVLHPNSCHFYCQLVLTQRGRYSSKRSCKCHIWLQWPFVRSGGISCRSYGEFFWPHTTMVSALHSSSKPLCQPSVNIKLKVNSR